MQSEDAVLVNTVCAYMTTFSVLSVAWMKRAPVIAGTFAAFEKAAKAATEFWNSVREGLNMTEKNDPRLRLRTALMTSRIGAGTGEGRLNRGQVKFVSSEQMYHWCIHAWNAFRRGDKLSALRAILSADRPKAK